MNENLYVYLPVSIFFVKVYRLHELTFLVPGVEVSTPLTTHERHDF
jgi:hypothetical protein